MGWNANTIVLPRIAPDRTSLARELRFACPPFTAYWNNPKDLSPYGNDLTQTGTVTRTGERHYGVTFGTGSGNYFTCATGATAHKVTGELTAMAWVRKTANQAFNCFFSYSHPATNFVWFMNWDAGSVSFNYSSNGSAASSVTGTSPTLGTWHHIAAVYMPSTYVELYIDGVLAGRSTSSIPSALFSTSSAALAVGATDTGASYFAGQIAHPYFWARCLAPKEIWQFADDPWFMWRWDVSGSMVPPPALSLVEWLGRGGNIQHPHARHPRQTIVF